MELVASKDPTRAIFPFLDLPRELRDMIYLYSCHPIQVQNVWENVHDKLVDIFNEEEAIHNAKVPEVAFKGNFWLYNKRLNPNDHFALTTPVLMLLNQQVFSEIKDVLRREPYVVRDHPPVDSELRMSQMFPDYITEASITHLRNVEIVYTEDSPIAPIIRWMANIWIEENHLEKLVVRFNEHVTGYRPKPTVYRPWNSIDDDNDEDRLTTVLAESEIAEALRKLHTAFPYEIIEYVDEDGKASNYRKDLQIGEIHD